MSNSSIRRVLTDLRLCVTSLEFRPGKEQGLLRASHCCGGGVQLENFSGVGYPLFRMTFSIENQCCTAY